MVGVIGSLKSFARRVLRPPLHHKDVKVDYVVLGTDYGGWPIVENMVDEESIVYSIGVGEDASWDLAVIAEYGCTIHAFDPTPKSIAWVAGGKLPEKFVFAPVGVAEVDGEAAFFPPENNEHVSFSSQPIRDRDVAPISAQVRRISTLMAERDHHTLDVLKLDIEGFEYSVIRDMLASEIRPRQLLVEFHHRMYGFDDAETLEIVARIRAAGYQLFYVSAGGHEYGFVFDQGGRK